MWVHGVLIMNLLEIFIIFGVDNSSSSHSENGKNNFLVLGQGPTYGVNWSFGSPEENLNINSTKAKLCLSLHYNADDIYLFVNGKKIFKFKAYNTNANFPMHFVSKVYLMDLILLSLEKYLYVERCIIFQSITIILINLTY